MRIVLIIAFAILATACANSQATSNVDQANTTTESAVELVPASEVQWGALNPARGDQSPRAGTLWGDRTAEGASGFLVKFVDGFSSPPHIHNVTYRGVVISGLIHNDDPKAEQMWLPAGSFWTQPAGEAHITAADGDNNMAYIEINSGPYLVKPTEEAFDNGERPVNVDQSNLVWLDAADITWIHQDKRDTDGPKTAFLWGKPEAGQLSGSLLKLPAAYSGTIHSSGTILRAVVIQGELAHGESAKALAAGSYFGSEGTAVHQIASSPDQETIVYIRTDGKIELDPTNTDH
jgi:quercetin dioxygenase-like cupin family protein